MAKARIFGSKLIVAMMLFVIALLLVVSKPLVREAWSENSQAGRPTPTPRRPTSDPKPRATPTRTLVQAPRKDEPKPGEETYWRTVDLTSIEEIEDYLKRFPIGFYTSLANLKLIKLGKVPTTTASFDLYGNIKFNDEKARLDNFAIALQNVSTAQGYIIAYSPRPDEAKNRADRVKDYLVNIRGIDAGRLVVVDGGLRTEVTVRLWIVPAGAVPPLS